MSAASARDITPDKAFYKEKYLELLEQKQNYWRSKSKSKDDKEEFVIQSPSDDSPLLKQYRVLHDDF